MKQAFFLCGSLGWCMEVFWTGCNALLQKDYKLTGRSSIWMFPIYGCAALIGPLSKKLSRLPLFFRGTLYTAGIFATEYSTGKLLQRFSLCPWDYSHTPYHYQGLIRLDYAPVWFVTGLIFEKILTEKILTDNA